ncbi:DUF6221 family protein [Streptomyces sp. NPDC047097]|uniref:DUF6221 family protein n=1 Tax=Streptomyces sp. NPDC047097 TaxID=3155260 RepID=UPI0033CE3A48
MTADLVAFLRARLDEDELWATEASRYDPGYFPDYPSVPGGVHWHWVANETDQELAPNPSREVSIGYDAEVEGAVSLRSRETWPSSMGRDLPQFALQTEEVPSAVGGHIIRHDPARALREVEAGRRLLRAHEKWCEGRCEAKYPEGGFDAAHFWNIKARAEVYADHPDYRQEWRP